MYFLFVLIEVITHAINASLPTQWQFIDGRQQILQRHFVLPLGY